MKIYITARYPTIYTAEAEIDGSKAKISARVYDEDEYGRGCSYIDTKELEKTQFVATVEELELRIEKLRNQKIKRLESDIEDIQKEIKELQSGAIKLKPWKGERL